MDLCPHCMRPAEGKLCPHCGASLRYVSPEQHLPVGAVLKGARGSYRIGAALGQGGFGVTYAAVELDSGRRAAVKEYFPARCAQRGIDHCRVTAKPDGTQLYQGGLDSFLEETRMLMGLESLPCVVHFWDFFQANGTAYLVMEYLDGPSLHQKVTKEGNLPAQELLFRLQPLLEDLDILHQARILHRDISPDNIIWTPDGTLKLLDFGCARSMEDGKSMTVLLKHGFAPVEQYQTQGQGPWTDVYAMAATIYYCITGKVPASAVERLEDEALASPRSLGADLTEEQEQALLWGLTVQPNSRPDSMGSFARRLFATPPSYQPQKAKKPAASAVPPTGPAGPMTGAAGPAAPAGTQGKGLPFAGVPGSSRRTLIIIGAAAAAILLAVILILVFTLGRRNDPGPIVTYPLTESAPATSRQPHVPQSSAEPSSPMPQGVSGVTETGYEYVISGGEAILTGYSGSMSNGFFSMPDDIDDVPITAIWHGAFADLTVMEQVLLPIHLETIGEDAFAGCTNLWRICAYSDVTCHRTAFDGCSALRCLQHGANDSFDARLPDDCRVFQSSMDLGGGYTMATILIDNGVLYCNMVDSDYTALLDVPAGTSRVELGEDVGWVYPGALDHADSGITIKMSPDLIFPFELYNEADWELPDATGGTVPMALNWMLSCTIADGINSQRPSDAPQIQPDPAFVRAAMVRAEELSQYYESDRPNGDKWSTALNDQDADWQHAASLRFRYDTESDTAFNENVADIMERYVDIREDYGTYANKIGVSIYLHDGMSYMQSLVNFPDPS